MDEDGPSRSIDWASFDGVYSQRLREARDDLRRIQSDMLASVDAAGGAKREGNKRPLGGDGPKDGDLAGDVGMVPNLTPAQVEDSFRGRIKEAADRYRHLQQLAAREVIGCADEKQELRQQQDTRGSPSGAAGASQRAARETERASGRSGAAAESGRRPLQRAASSGGARPAAHCISQWQTDEEREVERGRWRAGGKGARGRSVRPREEAERRREVSTRRRAGSGRPASPAAAAVAAAAAGEEGAAPVTPVDPQVAMGVSEEIGKVREGLATRMEQVVLQVETNAAAELIKEKVAVSAAIKEQERLQLLQEVEFAAACSRRASDAGLQTAQQRDKVRSLWIAQLASMGEGQMAETAFATYGPTGLPLEEQQRALRSAIRRAGVGDAADGGYAVGGSTSESVGDAWGQGHGQRSVEEEGDSGRSRSKSPRPRGGTRARRE